MPDRQSGVTPDGPARRAARTIALALTALLSVLAVGRVAPTAGAQAPDPDVHVPVDGAIDLTVGTKTYRARDPMQCRADRDASFGGIPAVSYAIAHDAGTWSLGLDVWQPKNGSAERMRLRVADGSITHLVDTARDSADAASGRITFERARLGATFAIDAVTAGGLKVTGTVRCSRFTGLMARGH